MRFRAAKIHNTLAKLLIKITKVYTLQILPHLNSSCKKFPKLSMHKMNPKLVSLVFIPHFCAFSFFSQHSQDCKYKILQYFSSNLQKKIYRNLCEWFTRNVESIRENNKDAKPMIRTKLPCVCAVQNDRLIMSPHTFKQQFGT